MRARVYLWLDGLRSGFWFLPSAMLGLAVLLAVAMLWADNTVDPGITNSIAWAYSGGPQGARSLLTTIAGSMINAATVTFSLAAVALSIASQQYGSRVLRNFMRDRITQVLLGTFTSTFIYTVLVVRAIRGTDVSQGFVPAISVTVAIALSLVSLILLIFFVHHISASIKASHILMVIGQDLRDALPRRFPSPAGEAKRETTEHREIRKGQATSVEMEESGYLQSVDLDDLFAFAKRRDLLIELLMKPGDYHLAGTEVARIWSNESLADDHLKKLRRAFVFGGERTPAQDIRYQFQQLTEVVIRALSPAINDPFVAMNGIDELASGISQLARHARMAEEMQDRDGVVRVIAPAPQVSEVLEHTVGHIAVYGASDPFVMARLRRILDVVEDDLHGDAEVRMLVRLRIELRRREAAAGAAVQ